MSFQFQQHLQIGLVFSSDAFFAAEFWPTIGEGQFHLKVLISGIRSTAHYILARFVISYLTFNKETDKINRDVLFFFWCFITGRHLKLPLMLSTVLRRRGGSRRRGSPIISTHRITAVANSYRINLAGLACSPPRLLIPSSLKNSGLAHKEGRHWVVGPAPADEGVEVAPPQARAPRHRAPRVLADPEVYPLTAQFDRHHTRIRDMDQDLSYRMDVNQQWNTRMILSVYEQQHLEIPEGFQYPYEYHPAPPFYNPYGPP